MSETDFRPTRLQILGTRLALLALIAVPLLVVLNIVTGDPRFLLAMFYLPVPMMLVFALHRAQSRGARPLEGDEA